MRELFFCVTLKPITLTWAQQINKFQFIERSNVLTGTFETIPCAHLSYFKDLLFNAWLLLLLCTVCLCHSNQCALCAKCRETQPTENRKMTLPFSTFRFVLFRFISQLLCTGTALHHSTAHLVITSSLNGGIQFDIIFSRGYVRINSIDMDICRRISICVLMREHLHLWNAFANCHYRAQRAEHR